MRFHSIRVLMGKYLDLIVPLKESSHAVSPITEGLEEQIRPPETKYWGTIITLGRGTHAYATRNVHLLLRREGFSTWYR